MILDHFLADADAFIPNTITQYTALQMLLRFGDQIHGKQYLVAADKYPLSRLISAYRKAVHSSVPSQEFFKQLSC